MTSIATSKAARNIAQAAVTKLAACTPMIVDYEVQAPGPGEVLIRVMASSVNPTDVATWHRGAFVTGETVPFVGGYDLAGVVIAVGRGVTFVAPGDCVAGMPRFPHPAGAFADHAVAPARHLARIPGAASGGEGVDWDAYGALPLAGLTAWQALVDTARVMAGMRVLIHAASGGVGHLAVQLAVHIGAQVTAVTSAPGLPLVRSLGADRVIDRHTIDWAELAGSQDVVLDTVGGTVTQLSLTLARLDGLVIALHPYANDELAASDARLRQMLVEPDHTALARLFDLHHRGIMRPHIGATFNLRDLGEALLHVHHQSTPGKTTIRTNQGE